MEETYVFSREIKDEIQREKKLLSCAPLRQLSKDNGMISQSFKLVASLPAKVRLVLHVLTGKADGHQTEVEQNKSVKEIAGDPDEKVSARGNLLS
ncbi:hypothetical protein Y1Q_0022082 [Alligator mississippiensis]|uniref:Uncharacterized protein n=1 Tax=Alligator mississippiensis TaxID=8496 RepID=A0A151NU99_ALLMI|nr:hypothetical protein Y1Q_0022082 [Alligator mississippiensis]